MHPAVLSWYNDYCKVNPCQLNLREHTDTAVINAPKFAKGDHLEFTFVSKEMRDEVCRCLKLLPARKQRGKDCTVQVQLTILVPSQAVF